ncbi:hypothetical protein GGQ88_001316 [Novosphingobium hassiacum]|uniref:DUF4136 domain-containing protein n=1 Tax=Novosphingobium hassiacum TaxID=173676 RepID=A0A7W5ZYJ4_9SPHN|nr:DUF4136 domain-containing protein [Novosphingobium hassiacum]MBB3860055.1 hypothetical protein [Novosphingobium hassiacum]
MKLPLLSCALVASLALPVFAQAQPYPQGGAWGSPLGDQRLRGEDGRRSTGPAARVDVEAFRATGSAAQLGKGPITVAAAPGAEAEWKLPVYEAAVVDQLAKLGYDTAVSGATGGQIAQIGITHQTVVPEEPKRKPVSGEMAVGVSNRGSYTALGLNIDLTKPRKAIVATRLDVRIRDRASDRVLWEGHAIAQTREDDEGLDNGAVAARLASALFDRFESATEIAPIG